MLEKIDHFVMDIAPFLPKKIIDWFNLTDTDVLHLQYISLVLPLIAFVLDWYIARMVGRNVSRKSISDLFKISFVLIVIICYDNVIRQYLPLAIRETLNSNMLLLEAVLSYVLLFIALFFTAFLLGFLCWTIKTIYLIVFKRVRHIPLLIRKGEINEVPVTFLMLFSLSALLQMVAVTFYSVVLYYNYCM